MKSVVKKSKLRNANPGIVWVLEFHDEQIFQYQYLVIENLCVNKMIIRTFERCLNFYKEMLVFHKENNGILTNHETDFKSNGCETIAVVSIATQDVFNVGVTITRGLQQLKRSKL